MVKSAQKSGKNTLRASLLSTLPWSCTSFGEESEIEAYVEAESGWKTIADVHPFMGFDGEEIASFILRAINDRGSSQKLWEKVNTVLLACINHDALPKKVKGEVEELIKEIADLSSAAVKSEASL